MMHRTGASSFCFNQAFFEKEGYPSNGAHDLDVIAPLLKKWERQTHHRVGHIVPFHQKEAFCFSASGLAETCIRAPSWFGPYEVHYGFHFEIPPVASYRGSSLMSDEQHPDWQIFLTKWAALISYELMYQARQGWLHFVSTSNRALIRAMSFSPIMFGQDGLVAQLETLVDKIDVIKWSEVSPRNRMLPDHACETPVSITGNWVAFHPEAWESQMDPKMYLVPDELGPVAFDYPRGSLSSLIDRRAEEQRTTGPVRSGDEGGVPPRYKLLEIVATAGEEARGALDAPNRYQRKNRNRAPWARKGKANDAL